VLPVGGSRFLGLTNFFVGHFETQTGFGDQNYKIKSDVCRTSISYEFKSKDGFRSVPGNSTVSTVTVSFECGVEKRSFRVTLCR
jgi:hypothetical protein